MNSTALKVNRTIEDLTLNVTQEIRVRASLEAVSYTHLAEAAKSDDAGAEQRSDVDGV